MVKNPENNQPLYGMSVQELLRELAAAVTRLACHCDRLIRLDPLYREPSENKKVH